MTVDVLTLGEPMGLLRGDSVGPLRAGSTAVLSCAGAELNVAIGLARLGHRVAYVGRIGDDLPGRVIREAALAEGVGDRLLVDPGAFTGLMVREHRTADRLVASYARAGAAGSRLSPTDVDDSLVRSATVLHLTGITLALSESARATVQHVVAVAEAAGVTISLDVNHRSLLWTDADARSALSELLPSLDVLFGSVEELALIDGHDQVPEVVTKRGAAGADVSVDGRTTYQPALPVTLIDPVGAGDAFVAGYLSARLDGLDSAGRLRRGAVCGAFAVSVAGDWEGLPRRHELTLLDGEENVRR